MNKDNVITSLQHTLVKHLVKLRLDADYRQEKQVLLFEGLKPIQEVAQWITKIFYTSDYSDQKNCFNVESWAISQEILKKISGAKNPEGLIAEVRMPTIQTKLIHSSILVLDAISDPGNMGTLLRTALAFGWKTIFFLPGCCDPFNDKVLRSARGAHFKLNLVKGTCEKLQEWIQGNHIQVLVADIEGIPPEKIKKIQENKILILGNEAHGISDDCLKLGTRITLPMVNEMESLNVAVAGGILLYVLSNRQVGIIKNDS